MYAHLVQVYTVELSRVTHAERICFPPCCVQKLDYGFKYAWQVRITGVRSYFDYDKSEQGARLIKSVTRAITGGLKGVDG